MSFTQGLLFIFWIQHWIIGLIIVPEIHLDDDLLIGRVRKAGLTDVVNGVDRWLIQEAMLHILVLRAAKRRWNTVTGYFKAFGVNLLWPNFCYLDFVLLQ